MRQQFREDATGTLEYYPPEQYVPTSATVILNRPGGAVLQASANATCDTASTTVSVAAQRGARSFTVSSATNMAAGRKYLVEDSGQKWVCEIATLSSSTVYPRQPVPFALTTNATVKGYRITYSLTTTHTAERGDEYTAEWSYTANSVSCYHVDIFDVVSLPHYCPTTMDDVTAQYPHVSAWLQSDEYDGRELIRNTWDQRLIPSLAAKGYRIERIRDVDQLRPYHCALVNEACLFSAYMRDGDKGQQYEAARARAAEQLDLLCADVTWYDVNDDKVASEDEKHTINHVRIMR